MKKIVNCQSCSHSTLVIYQQGHPLCSVCKLNGEKDVADRMHPCELYEPDKNKKEILKPYEEF